MTTTTITTRQSPCSAALSSKVLIGVVVAAYAGAAHRAVAAELVINESSVIQLAQASTPTEGALSVIRPTPTSPASPYFLADQLKIRGWAVPVPGAADTLDQGLFGARKALAEHGISFLGVETTTFSDNLIRHGLPAGNALGPHSRQLQQYIGQLPTYQSVNNAYVNFDLRQYGIPDGQITVAANLISTNYKAYGPDGLLLGICSTRVRDALPA